SVEMMQALRLGAERVVADTAVQVIVIRGAGEHFMAGGDIKDFHAHLRLDPPARLQAFQAMIEQWINPTVLALRRAHQPVIGAVRGACAGFGLSLMLGCDLALAADNAYFATAYAHIALSPDGGGTWFLPRIVGQRKAAELLLLSERVSAQQALELGLINRIVPLADLEAETARLAERLKNGPRHAYGEMKRLLAGSPDRPWISTRASAPSSKSASPRLPADRPSRRRSISPQAPLRDVMDIAARALLALLVCGRGIHVAHQERQSNGQDRTHASCMFPRAVPRRSGARHLLRMGR
ncbi:MAG: enoyl-CoA hydratase, partial [Proteobacteria bacterium]|nr:enoyl-CoA hydratase [Pseudomonadota bacterium]